MSGVTLSRPATPFFAASNVHGHGRVSVSLTAGPLISSVPSITSLRPAFAPPPSTSRNRAGKLVRLSAFDEGRLFRVLAPLFFDEARHLGRPPDRFCRDT